VQAEDFDITVSSNVINEGDEEEMKGEDGNTTSQIAIEDTAGLPAAKKIKLEEE
jgi:hypothetical protein